MWAPSGAAIEIANASQRMRFVLTELAPDFQEPATEGDADASGEESEDPGETKSLEKSCSGRLIVLELVIQLVHRNRLLIWKINHAEEPVAGQRRNHEAAKRPVDHKQRKKISGAGNQSEQPLVASLQPRAHEVERERRKDEQHGKSHWDHVRHIRVHGPELGLRGKQGKNPQSRQIYRHVNRGNNRSSPFMAGSDRIAHDQEGRGYHQDAIKDRA